MTQGVYGVDIDGQISPVDARDALVRCFVEAHDGILKETIFSGAEGVDSDEIKKMESMNVQIFIKQLFEKVGGDYDHPDKKSLLSVAEELRKFSINFRDQEIIERHFKEMNFLFDRLPD